MRNMVSIREIGSLSPIEGADRIELATVDGWKVVVAKGIHNAGDKVAYFEIDTLLPEDNPLFEQFTSRSVKHSVDPEGNKVKGHVLKTIKLRGQISQGAIMPLDVLGLSPDSTQEQVDKWMEDNGVFKHEPIAVVNNPHIVNQFPIEYARKTDSERVQNLSDEFISSLDKSKWFATEKIDGTSATFFVDSEGNFRAASRNYEVDVDGDSPYAVVAREFNLAEILEPGQVIQGEIFGEGIQGNPLKVKGVRLGIFHTDNISVDDKAYDFVQSHIVPVLDMVMPDSIEQAIEQVDGMKSTINPKVNAEGVVWWHKDGQTFRETGERPNFKTINNKFLLKHGG